jgi:hypothetical protein
MTCLMIGLLFPACLAQTPEQPARALKQRYDALVREYEAADLAWTQRDGTGQLTDPQAQLIARYKDWPAWSFAPRFVQLAEEGGQDPAASDALTWVAGRAPQVGTGDAGLAPAFRRAFELLSWGSRLDDRRVLEACRPAFRYPSPWIEGYLRTTSEKSGNREVRGLACLHLARILEGRRSVAFDPWFERGDLTPFQSFLRGRLDPVFIAYVKTTDLKAVEQESKDLLERVIREFGDVKVNNPRAGAPEQTLAELAHAELDDLCRPDLGRPGPEISGLDSAGKPLRLGDQRGKFVVLVFFAGWSEDDRQLLEALRGLAGRHKAQPLVIVGVACDKDPDRLRDATAKGEVPWRCWHDGLNGPIARSWGIRRLPTLFVLDPAGTVRLKDYQSERLEKEVERLLRDARLFAR